MRIYQDRFYRPSIELLGTRQLPGNLFSLQFHGFADESNQLSLVHDEMWVVSVPSLQSTQNEQNDWMHLQINDRRNSTQWNTTSSTRLNFNAFNKADSTYSLVASDRPINRDANTFGTLRNLDIVDSIDINNSSIPQAPVRPNTSALITQSNAAYSLQSSELTLHDKALFQYVSRPPAKSGVISKQSSLSFSESSVGEISQDVPINCDNDNGSTVTYTIPAVRDFNAGFTSSENDLVLLNVQWVLVDPVPPEILILPIINRSWTLNQAGGSPATMKMWLDAQKAILAPSSGTGYFPTVWLEGTEPSDNRNDVISITATRTDTHKGGYTAQYQMKTVKATITPVVDSSDITGVEPRVVAKLVGDPPQLEYSITYGFNATVYVNSTVYLGSYPNPLSGSLKGNPRYIQNVDAINDNLIYNGTEYAVRFVDQDRYSHQIVPQQNVPNNNYPFLDKISSPPSPYNDPYYDEPNYNDQVTSLGNSTVNVFMEDYPGLGENPPIQEIWFTTFFSTHLTWSHVDGSEPVTTYPLGYFNWYIHFSWVANSTPQGDNTGSWLIVTAGYVPSHSVPNMLVPTIANDAIELLPI